MCAETFRNLLLLVIISNLSVNSVFGLSKDTGSPDVVEVENGPPGVVWIVQMSDIHISKWVPERGDALRKSLGRTLKIINPAVVLVSGDLTDAKNKDRTATRQDEDEWIEYRDSFQKVVNDSGIPQKKFYDLRGNHDKYGVPLFSPLDYHSTYSISACMNRTSLVQSVTVKGRDGRRHLFVGFDDSMEVGLRGPANTFGHFTDDISSQLDFELKRWDNVTSEPTTKIVFGHFPMSFTVSSETGKRPEDVMAANDVTAYLCGHLHTKFGRRLYKHHEQDAGGFWEWEMGDWRVSRMMRVLAIDNGHTSFVDVELIPPKATSEMVFTMPTIVLQTYPLDSRFMVQGSRKGVTDSTNSIRALVFSETTPVSVTARIYDFGSHPPKLVNESLMKLVDGGVDKTQHGAYYYVVPWEREKYVHASPLKYAMQLFVEDAAGNITHSEMRTFSADGEHGEFHLTALAFLVLGFRWETFFPILLWSMLLFCLSVLVISKIFLTHLQNGDRYEDWVTSVFTPTSDFQGALGKIVTVPFWASLEAAKNNYLWVGMIVYVSYLIFFPWFLGRVLADDYPIGWLSLHGWTVRPSNDETIHTRSGLAKSDMMTIVLPYVYGVLFPLLLMLSALSAERAACEFHLTNIGKFLKKRRFITKPEPRTDSVNNEADAAQSSVNSALEVKEELLGQGELDILLPKEDMENVRAITAVFVGDMFAKAYCWGAWLSCLFIGGYVQQC